MLGAMLYVAAAVSSAQASQPSEHMLSAAERLTNAAPEISKLWPGYWPVEQAFIIYSRDQGALLVADDPPPPSFRALADHGLPPSLRGRTFYHAGTLQGAEAPFVLDYPIGGGRTAVLVAEGTTLAATIGTILHEQFHDFQEMAFESDHRSEFIAASAVPDRASFAAGAETERTVLTAALAADSRDQRNTALHQYLALRREREAALPASAVTTERGLERIEGTAKYVEILGSEMIFGGGDPAIEARLISGLRQDLTGGNGPFMTNWFRWRSYGTGAAISYLLDEIGDSDWRARAAGGAPLDELLAEVVDYQAVANPSELARAARDQFEYENNRARLEPLIRASKEITTVEQFYALAPYRVVVEFEAPMVDGKTALHMGFSTRGGMDHLTPSQMVLRDPERVSVTIPGGSLIVRERPFMSHTSGFIQRLTTLLPSVPSINGRAAPQGEHRFDTAEIRGPGYELTVSIPVVVEVLQDAMMIRLRRADADDE